MVRRKKRRALWLMALSLLLAHCGPSEEEKRTQRIQEQLRLLQEQVIALEEENASLKASVTQMQAELDRMNAELAAQGARVSRLKATVGLLEEPARPSGFWPWLKAKLTFLVKLLALIGVVALVYYLFQRRRRHTWEEWPRPSPGADAVPARADSAPNSSPRSDAPGTTSES